MFSVLMFIAVHELIYIVHPKKKKVFHYFSYYLRWSSLVPRAASYLLQKDPTSPHSRTFRFTRSDGGMSTHRTPKYDWWIAKWKFFPLCCCFIPTNELVYIDGLTFVQSHLCQRSFRIICWAVVGGSRLPLFDNNGGLVLFETCFIANICTLYFPICVPCHNLVSWVYGELRESEHH